MAAEDGKRRLPAIGNANHRLTWTITNLTGGMFYWSVQAVDHSFAGSAFAIEQSFFVTNRPPTSTDISVSTAEDTLVSIFVDALDLDRDPLALRLQTPPAFGQVTGAFPYFRYTPASNYFGSDQFTYVVNDRTEDSPPATVSIQVTPVQDVATPSIRINWLQGQAMRLSLMGEPWEQLRIEVSDDLINWATLTNFVGTNLVVHWTDPDASNLPKRFYRARWSESHSPSP